MKLHTIRLHNFQSFGEAPTDIDLDDLTYLIGFNGSGKKAALIALCRVFSIDPALRRVQRSSSEIRMPIGARSLSESRAKRRLVLTHAEQRERPAGYTKRWDVARKPQFEYFGSPCIIAGNIRLE